ncbi:Intramembrane protease RasP/YluC, implicated in cell division based on FtsL cleavage [Olavius sp. associated proteobacterium Delta 1]|nr:Intramembrane protease RasP/YluC, implicated in cell division based on FtsL cleavage [Olavius sp. associated proteobacterium Delta 1]
MGTNIFAFIIVLGVLIFFHEFGHFLVARLFGVGVEKFSLGFGPRLIGKKIGITDYRLSAIPLGGYVKMVGEEPDAEIDPADLPLSFTHKHVVQRMLIVAAGPVFNILLAVLIFFVSFSITGIDDIKPVIRQLQKDSVAQKAGLQVHDRIVSIDDTGVDAWYDIDEAVAESKGKTLTLGVVRNGTAVKIDVKPELKQGIDLLGDNISYYDLGISALPELMAIVGDVSAGLPAEKAGLKKGDQIIAINGIPIDNWRQMQSLISSSGGVELTISVRRGEDDFKVNLTPQFVEDKNHLGQVEKRYLIGISTQPINIPEADLVTKRLNPFKAAVESLSRTYSICALMIRSVVKMIDGSIPKENLGGPIMIAKLAGDQAKQGIGKLVQFIAFISINLAIINLLPIPVLDGGHLLFFTIEGIKGRPVSIKVREVAQQVGLFILILLMILVFYNDLTRFIFI